MNIDALAAQLVRKALHEAHWACGDGRDAFGCQIDHKVAYKVPWGKNKGKYSPPEERAARFKALHARMGKRARAKDAASGQTMSCQCGWLGHGPECPRCGGLSKPANPPATRESLGGFFPREVQQTVDAVGPMLGDVITPETSDTEAREECWTLCVDYVNQNFGFDGETPQLVAAAACERLGYPNHSVHKSWRQAAQGKEKSPLAGYLKTLGYDSYAAAVNDLGMGDWEARDIEDELAQRAAAEVARRR